MLIYIQYYFYKNITSYFLNFYSKGKVTLLIESGKTGWMLQLHHCCDACGVLHRNLLSYILFSNTVVGQI